MDIEYGGVSAVGDGPAGERGWCSLERGPWGGLCWACPDTRTRRMVVQAFVVEDEDAQIVEGWLEEVRFCADAALIVASSRLLLAPPRLDIALQSSSIHERPRGETSCKN